MARAVYEVELRDDVTNAARSMAAAVKELRKGLSGLSSAFAKLGGEKGAASLQNALAGIKSAQTDLAGLAATSKEFAAAMKDAAAAAKALKDGVKGAVPPTAKDTGGRGTGRKKKNQSITDLLGEIGIVRKTLDGLKGFIPKVFSPRAIWATTLALKVAAKGFTVLKGAASAAFVVLAAGAGVAAKAAKFIVSKVLDAAEFREATLAGLENILKSKEEAKDVFNFALRAAQQTPLDTRYVIDSLNALVSTGGFTGKEAKQLLNIVADQAAKFGTGVGDQVITALSRVRSRGYAVTRDISESLLAARIQPTKVYEELAKKLNIRESDPLKRVVAVRKELGKAGTVGAYTFLNAVQRALQQGGVALGAYSEAQSKTLRGVFSNAKEAIETLLGSVDLQNWPGVLALKGFLLKVTASFDASSVSGKKLLETVQRITDSLLGGLDQISQSDVDSFFVGLGDIAIDLTNTIKEAFADVTLDEVKGAFQGLAYIIEAIVASLRFAAKTLDVIAEYSVKTAQFFGAFGGSSDEVDRVDLGDGRSIIIEKSDIGRELQRRSDAGKGVSAENIADFLEDLKKEAKENSYVKSLEDIKALKKSSPGVGVLQSAADGVEGYIPRFYAAGAQLAEGAEKGFVDRAEIRSPSVVMMRRAEQLAEGAIVGFDRAASRGERGGLGGGIPPITLNVNVMTQTGDPDALAQAIRPAVFDAMTSVFERFATGG